jgi:hypothetical protein
MAAPELSIIIVNWNAGDLLSRCVDSIARYPPKTEFEVVVIDNASDDGSLEQLLSSSSLSSDLLSIIRNPENKGFGIANNQVFSQTTSSFVFLLNPDAEVTDGAIDTLLETMKADQRVGACGPKLLNPDGSTQISVYFNPPRWWHTLFWQLKLYQLLPRRIRGELLLGRHWDHSRMRDVPMIIGAALMARRDVIEQVGGFDERFHMYSEDNEWCWRIIRAGWRIVFNPAAVVVHGGGQSAKKRWTADEKVRVQLDSEFKFVQLALPRLSLIANQLANCAVVSAQVALRRVRRVEGLDLDTLSLIKSIHTENLKRILKRQNRNGSPKTHRGIDAS